MFLQRLSHCLLLKYCRGCLIWIANGQNLHFVQKYICFILLRGDLNISGWETDEKWTRLCCNSMDVLPSRQGRRYGFWAPWTAYSLGPSCVPGGGVYIIEIAIAFPSQSFFPLLPNQNILFQLLKSFSFVCNGKVIIFRFGFL